MHLQANKVTLAAIVGVADLKEMQPAKAGDYDKVSSILCGFVV